MAYKRCPSRGGSGLTEAIALLVLPTVFVCILRSLHQVDVNSIKKQVHLGRSHV